jgi:hypothetical protein
MVRGYVGWVRKVQGRRFINREEGGSMMRSTYGLTAVSCILILAVFVSTGPVPAQESEAKGSGKKVAKEGEVWSQDKLVAAEWKVHREYLKNMLKLDDLLVKAGEAAKAGESDEALSEIHEARKLIDQIHQSVHQHMGKKIEHVAKMNEAEGKKQEWKPCPFCEKAAASKQK